MYSEAAERPEFGDRRQVVTAGEYHEPRVAAGRAARPLGRFEPREVTMGASAEEGMVQIVAGLAAGDNVVTSGQFLLDAEFAGLVLIDAERKARHLAEPVGEITGRRTLIDVGVPAADIDEAEVELAEHGVDPELIESVGIRGGSHVAHAVHKGNDEVAATAAFGLGNLMCLFNRQRPRAFQDIWAECEVIVLNKQENLELLNK